jgi:uncharacterized membrane protein
MGDMAGILILLGLGLLAVPVLLVVALVKIGHAKSRIEALEQQLVQLRLDVQRQTQQAASVAAPAATADSQPDVARNRAPAAPTVTQPLERADIGEGMQAQPLAEKPAATSGVDTTRFADADMPKMGIQDAPQLEAAMGVATSVPPGETATPPPLPWRRAVAVGTTASEEQDRRATGEPPSATSTRSGAPSPRVPPSDPFAVVARLVKAWFTEGNVPVKIGVMVLLAGVAALLKYASDQGWVRVPIELRLAGIAAAAIGAFVFAWRQREKRRSFALSLQGGAIGVLMLVVFAAFKLYDGLLPAGPAFAITIALVAGLGVLAVLQRALAMAVFGILAGFLAPIWLSTGSGNHVALFSYYAVLNLGIFAIAWAQSRRRGAWRLLNLLGFVFTFGIGAVWGVLDYDPKKFASTEPFLLLFFGLYLLIPIFYARSRGEGRRDLVDGTLVFGVPLVTFALQTGVLHDFLVRGERMPLAFSALALAAVYAVLGGVLHRLARMRPLVESYAVLAVGFATLAVPLALSAGASASVFALEGAALVWLGLRQRRRLPQLSGLLLQIAAATAYFVSFNRYGAELVQATNGQWVWSAMPTPVANPAFMGAVLISLAGVVIAYSYRKVLDRVLVAVLTLWALAWWTFAGLNEIDMHTPYRYELAAVLAFVIFSGWLAAEARRRVHELPMLGIAAAAALAFAIMLALAQSARHGHPFAQWGWAAWALYAALGWRSLMCLRGTALPIRGVAHIGWWWAWTVAVACFLHDQARGAALGEGWQFASVGVPVLALAALSRVRPRMLAAPLAVGFDEYRMALAISATVASAGLWGLSLFSAGDSAPLPWLVVLNPLELLQIAVLLLLAHWAWRGERLSALMRVGVPMFAIASFVWITFATLRATHHWAGGAWSPAMLGETEVQTALTVVWSVLGVLGWVFGSRRGDRMLWGAGAVLMAVVLLKLLLIDRGHLGNIFGIISFIAYGLLCTAVGYFAPAPPKREATA